MQTGAVAAKYKAQKKYIRNLFVIPNPVPQSIVERQLLVSKEAQKRLLAIGRFDEGKQFSLLIRVFASIASLHPDWSLRIVGDGPLRSALQLQISDLGLGDRVQLPGLSNAIGDELAKADAFVMTSKFEGFPNVLLEAMAFGLPCVAFDCPSGPREISMDGQVAILVPLNDEPRMVHALHRLMDDEALRLSLGSKACGSVVERFTLSKILTQWDELFAIVKNQSSEKI